MNQTDSLRAKKTFDFFKTRLFASIFMVLVTSTLMIPGMATYLPLHQNDTIGIPILLFPFIWTGLFIYCYLETSIKRLWLVLITLTFIHAACVYFALAG